MSDFLKKLVNMLNIMEYISFGLATIFVLVFQFTGLPIFITLALTIYTVAFLILFTASVIECKELFDKTRGVEVIKVSQNNTEDESINVKQAKTWAIVKTVLSGLFMIFTLVVLILF